ncbi:tetratricopeptide repeat-containing sensor histidine kinase [Flavobacterium limnophilum]|uniref:tetratricopeptide repeat-containing sensor histidine kinase n=1 Tax=Flavobacterium limnophilum TaxID=3003262 RepID=UPI0024825347|nr:sensor histidine kinase [Flavobacterium limnophilum]
MKAQFKIIVLVNFFFLFFACQKDDKKEVSFVLKKLESSKAENFDKEIILDSLYQYLSNRKNDSINRNYYFKVASKYYSIDKYDKFFKAVDKVNKLAIKEKDTVHIAKSLYFFGDYYEEKSQLDSAFSYYSQSEKLFKLINDTLNTGKTTLYKSGILLDAGIFTESEIKAITALRFLSKTNDTRLVYECYNCIAISLKELNDFKKSLEYFALALKQLDQLEKENYPKEKTIKSRIACYNNIGRVYQKMKNYQKAINYYNKGLQTKNIKQDYPKSYALLLDNLGYSKMKSGNYEGIENLFLESLRIRDSLGMDLGVATSKIDLGEYYLLKKDTAKGFTYLKEGYSLAKKFKSSPYVIQSLKLLMENDSKNKTYYTNQYLKIGDSIQQVERATRNKFARIAYETDQVEEKNVMLSKTITNIIIGSGIIVFLLGGFLSIYRLKSRNKELLFIKEQQEANEKIYQLMLNQQAETEQARNEERNRIAMELHDGIVNSIFTTRFNLMQLEPGALDKKQQLVEELQKAENEIRRVSHDLKQNLLFEDETLPEILANLIKAQQNEFNTKFDLSVDKYIDWSAISSDAKIHVYRIIQEALQNSNKYSKAARCCVFLLKTDDKTTIRIWDNGMGFNPEKAKQGIGLKNIKERVKSLNGELKITSSPEKGTTIEIVF